MSGADSATTTGESAPLHRCIRTVRLRLRGGASVASADNVRRPAHAPLRPLASCRSDGDGDDTSGGLSAQRRPYAGEYEGERRVQSAECRVQRRHKNTGGPMKNTACRPPQYIPVSSVVR